MISCRECLSTVSTGGYAEMQPTSEIGMHCATCADCARVVTDVRERERSIAQSLDHLSMKDSPAVMAQQAVVSSRRYTAHVFRMCLLGALMATISIGVVNKVIPAVQRSTQLAFDGDMVTETVPLSCINPQQATDLATPFLRSGKPAVYTARDIQAVTVRGTRRELEQAKKAIHDFDVRCELPQATTRSSDELGRERERQRMIDAVKQKELMQIDVVRKAAEASGKR